MNDLRKALVGKTITGVIARPSQDGHPELLVLALEDGSYMQFVTSRRSGRRRGHHALASTRLKSSQAISRDIFPHEHEQLPLIHTACG